MTAYNELVVETQGLDIVRWKHNRASGSYYTESRSIENCGQTFTEWCQQLGLTFEINRGALLGEAYSSHVMLGFHGNTINVSYHESLTTDITNLWATTTETQPQSYINWWFMGAHGPTSQTMPLAGNDPKDEFYPWLDNGIEAFARDFANSDANVLLLLGAPGTGKTSFIRGLIRAMDYNTWVTYDPIVQETEGFYVAFASIDGNSNEKTMTISPQSKPTSDWSMSLPANARGDGRILVLEDCDTMLSKRSEGNKMMNRLLNLSDGLVTLPQRKLIFSTNLPGIRDVDEAILRPGRCFACVQFRQLTREEAVKACASVGREPKMNKDKMTLSEALNGELSHNIGVQKIGF